jgi:putative acetyltransferase
MIRVIEAQTEPAISQGRTLFREYSLLNGVEICLQDFEAELASLPGFYARPTGRLFLALHDGPADQDATIGCVGLRKLDTEICEMKRLYVRPVFRNQGAGRALVEKLIAEARAMDYKKMRLDTLPIMREAHALYKNLGFVEIPPYIENRPAHALYFELALR